MHPSIPRLTTLALSTGALLGLGLAHAGEPTAKGTGNPAPASDPTSDPAERGLTALFSWGDVDGDGRLDLASVDASGRFQLLTNAGDGRFEDVTERMGLATSSPIALALWADYDGDSRLDLFVGAREGASHLYHNDGGQFTDMSAGSGLTPEGPVRSAQWLDHDADGRLDLFVVGDAKSELSVQLFRGLEGGFFELAELPLAGGAKVPGLGGPIVLTNGESAGAVDAPPASGSKGGKKHAPDKPLAGERTVEGAPSGGRIAVTPTITEVSPLIASNCTPAIVNQANPAACIQASTTPTLGKLYPISSNLFVAVGGNVGVGTTTPSEKLDVVGNAKVSGSVTASKGAFGIGSVASGYRSTISGGFGNTASGDDSTASGGFVNVASGTESTVSGGIWNEALASDSTVSGGSSNIANGACATIPGGKNNLAQGQFSFAAGRRAKANHTGSFVWGDSVNVDKTSSADNQFNVYAEGGMRVFSVGQTTSSMEVTATGKVGIGTSTPDGGLSVTAQKDNVTPTQPGVHMGREAGGYINSTSLEIVADTTGVPVLDMNRIGSGQSDFGARLRWDQPSDTLNLDGANLQVNGNICATGTIGACSDARFKTNVVEVEDALALVQELRGVRYDWKRDEFPARHFSATQQIGFIAQEVNEVVPEAVAQDEDGYYFVDYAKLTPVLVEAVQQLASDNDELRAEKDEAVAELQSENAELRERVGRLESVHAEVASLKAALTTLLENR